MGVRVSSSFHRVVDPDEHRAITRQVWVAGSLLAFEGISLLLIQSSPLKEELERIAEQVFPLVHQHTAALVG